MKSRSSGATRWVQVWPRTLPQTRPARALVLEAPFTAVADRAGTTLLAPVHMLMWNQYRSRDVIKDIHAPLLILHGDKDYIIPIDHGRALFALAVEPKKMLEYTRYGHLNLYRTSAYGDAIAWMRANGGAHK